MNLAGSKKYCWRLRFSIPSAHVNFISPYANTRGRFTRSTVSRSDNPLFINQSSATKSKAPRCDQCLPRPCSFGGLFTTHNSSAGFISAFSWSGTSTTSPTAASAATSIPAITAVVAALPTVLFHVMFVLTRAVSTVSPCRTRTLFVHTIWKARAATHTRKRKFKKSGTKKVVKKGYNL